MKTPDILIMSVVLGTATDPFVQIDYQDPLDIGRQAWESRQICIDKQLIKGELDDLLDTLQEIIRIGSVEKRLSRER